MNIYERFDFYEEDYNEELALECERAEGFIIAARILISKYKDLIHNEVNKNVIISYKIEINKLKEDILQAQAMIKENTKFITC